MKLIKYFFITVLVIIALAIFVGMPYMKQETKKYSPEKIASYTENGMNISVDYSSPSKKGRVIFGELVPFDKIWRTGANEPTTFTTATDITIDGERLPRGTYSLWSKPNPQVWEVYFNSEIPDWGVTILSGGADTTHNPDKDIITLKVPVQPISEEYESFTILFESNEGLRMSFLWDTTKVSVPLSK